MLFPETVFNAPASHLAAILGISGASYTVVGDGAVGILALKLAEDLIASSDLDACLVVAARKSIRSSAKLTGNGASCGIPRNRKRGAA
jgi:3-oxoacyl-(acyl-carrier-protein) synthase